MLNSLKRVLLCLFLVFWYLRFFSDNIRRLEYWSTNCLVSRRLSLKRRKCRQDQAPWLLYSYSIHIQMEFQWPAKFGGTQCSFLHDSTLHYVHACTLTQALLGFHFPLHVTVHTNAFERLSMSAYNKRFPVNQQLDSVFPRALVWCWGYGFGDSRAPVGVFVSSLDCPVVFQLKTYVPTKLLKHFGLLK